MKLSIGILAHNEEGAIGATIASLLGQSALSDSSISTEIIVVANGCADRTVDVAAAALEKAPAGVDRRVVDIETPGKANAWNVFIHEASAPEADYFILLDADIEFAAPDAIARLVGHLAENPEIDIAPDQPVKKFSDGGGALRPVIRALQKSGSDSDHALSGQLYAARAPALRNIVMPLGIVVEDGFLRAMVLTRSFSEPETLSRIRRAPGVSHFYRPYETISEIWRYERRQAVGTAINRFLYDELRFWRAAAVDIASEIARRNREDVDWLEKLIAEGLARSGFLAVPANYALRRLRRRENWSPANIVRTPLIAASVGFDIAVALAASRQLRGGAKYGGRWETIRPA